MPHFFYGGKQMHFISGTNFNELYRNTCSVLLSVGEEVSPRGEKTLELMNACLRLGNPRRRIVTLKGRKISMRYLIGELCFYFSLSDQLSFISRYSKFWNNVSDDGETVNSSYGKRIFDSNLFNHAIDCLASDPNSRKAVIPIYQPHDSKPSKDNPCTMYMQFLIRNHRLHCNVHMRSNDIWFGLTYDVPFFTLVQELMLVQLQNFGANINMGEYNHFAGSLHAYEKQWMGVLECAHQNAVDMPVPELELADATERFRYLLGTERYLREGGTLKSGTSTPFQTWAVQQLEGKNNELFDNTDTP